MPPIDTPGDIDGGTLAVGPRSRHPCPFVYATRSLRFKISSGVRRLAHARCPAEFGAESPRRHPPWLGWFAATLRMLASGEFSPRDERPLFHEVLAETDLPGEQAAFLVETVLSAWDETGEPAAILEYDEFDTMATRAFVEIFMEDLRVPASRFQNLQLHRYPNVRHFITR